MFIKLHCLKLGVLQTNYAVRNKRCALDMLRKSLSCEGKAFLLRELKTMLLGFPTLSYRAHDSPLKHFSCGRSQTGFMALKRNLIFSSSAKQTLLLVIREPRHFRGREKRVSAMVTGCKQMSKEWKGVRLRYFYFTKCYLHIQICVVISATQHHICFQQGLVRSQA